MKRCYKGIEFSRRKFDLVLSSYVLHGLSSELRQIFSDREVTSIRIVVNPEKMVVKEAQRSFTYLNIYEFNVDAVIVNRIIPDNVTDQYFTVWKDIQKKYKEMIKDSFSPIPIYYAPLFEQEIVGLEMLDRMGLYYLDISISLFQSHSYSHDGP